jgi:hypothetical protein
MGDRVLNGFVKSFLLIGYFRLSEMILMKQL